LWVGLIFEGEADGDAEFGPRAAKACGEDGQREGSADHANGFLIKDTITAGTFDGWGCCEAPLGSDAQAQNDESFEAHALSHGGIAFVALDGVSK